MKEGMAMRTFLLKDGWQTTCDQKMLNRLIIIGNLGYLHGEKLW